MSQETCYFSKGGFNMNTEVFMRAETFISDLKSAIDEVWTKYNTSAPLNKLIYARGGYGLMQHEEIKEILHSLESLKKQLDDLSEECRTIPVDLIEIDYASTNEISSSQHMVYK